MSEPLTMADLEKAVRRMRETSHAMAVQQAQDVAHFWDSVPSHLRSHPLISEMSMFVGHIVHPRVREEYRRRYEALLEVVDA